MKHLRIINKKTRKIIYGTDSSIIDKLDGPLTKDYIISEATEIKDTKGVMSYEGDIVLLETDKGIIEGDIVIGYDDNEKIKKFYIRTMDYCYTLNKDSILEVINNIWEIN